jgi:DNA-binding response OmpR family regulator
VTSDSNSKRVLIVEDELLVRMFAVDALEDEGFSVIQAGTAAEALAGVPASLDGLCAVVVDLGLPDRSGDEVAERLRALRADLPIVIASGRSEAELKGRFAKDAAVAILVKPYTASMLIAALESLQVKPR